MKNRISERIAIKRIVFPKVRQAVCQTDEINPVPGERQVTIRTRYSLISPGTELAMYTGTHNDFNNPQNTWAKLPFYPGYASIGEVVAAGGGVGGIAAGDSVFTLGHHASYDVLDYAEDAVTKLPEGMDPKKALFARMAEVAMNGVIHCEMEVGDSIVLLGMGMVGNLAAQLFALKGANVIGVDVVRQRLDIARQTNIASTVLSGEDVDLEGRIREMTGGRDADAVVEATGSPALINTALKLVRRLGQVILLGSPRGPVEINAYEHIHKKGVHLIGAHTSARGVYGLPDSAQLTRYVLDLIHKGALSVEPLLTHVITPDKADEAYDMLLNNKTAALGVILDWTAEAAA